MSKGRLTLVTTAIGVTMTTAVLYQVIQSDTMRTDDSKLSKEMLQLDGRVTRTATDADGTVYACVKIRAQWWMAENLRATHYGNGDPIPHLIDN